MKTGELQDNVTLNLTPSDAQMFLEYRKNQDAFQTLVQSGVFNVRNGQAVLSFDHVGSLIQVDFNVIAYKRGKPIVQVFALL